jgi:hypothetical protein
MSSPWSASLVGVSVCLIADDLQQWGNSGGVAGQLSAAGCIPHMKYFVADEFGDLMDGADIGCFPGVAGQARSEPSQAGGRDTVQRT